MIAAISKIESSFVPVIKYMENKVQKLDAVRLVDNTFSISSHYNEYINTFNQVCEQNSRLYKNLGVHISLNMHPDEQISNDKFRELINDYMTGLGYNDCPFVAYRHYDKDHSHVHIIASSVNWDGEKVSEYKNFERSQRLSREIEIKHKLKITTYDLSDKAKLNLATINARKYYVQKALKKAIKDYSAKSLIPQYLDEKQIKNIKYNSLTNDQCKELLGKNYDQVLSFLHQRKYFNSLLKDELKEKLVQLYNSSNNSNEFIDKLGKNNIYIRKVFKNNAPVFIYGMKDDNFFIKDNSLPKEFKYKNLSGEITNQIEFNSKDDLKSFLRKNISYQLNQCVSLENLTRNLNQKGIETITYQNTGGIYGVAFKMHGDEDKNVIPGSEISRDLSWNSIQKVLNHNSNNTFSYTEKEKTPNMIEKPTEKDFNPLSYNYIPPLDSPSQDDDLAAKRKLKLKQKRNRDHGRT